MNRALYLLLFTLAGIHGCRKVPLPDSQPEVVKFYPTDSSYKTNGSYQLQDGNYLLYGYDAANEGVLPLILKINPAGSIIWQKKLDKGFHYLTVKPISGGNLLAVGVEDVVADAVHVCMMGPDSNILFSIPYFIDDSVSAQPEYLPDFVEEENGDFTICGHIFINKFYAPFVLRINHEGQQLNYRFYDTLAIKTDLRTVAMARNQDGYSLTGTALNSAYPRGMFFIRLNEDYEVTYDTIMSNEDETITVGTIISNETDNSNIICGTYNGQDFSGILYIRTIDASGNVGSMQSFTDYDNLGRFRDINHTTDGGYILAATVDQIEGFNLVSSAKIYLLKLSAGLSFEWSRQFSSAHPLIGVSAMQTTDGGYLVGGYEHTASYIFTMLMIKTDVEGNIIDEF